MIIVKLNFYWFFNGYGVYGFKDKKWKYEGNVIYFFCKCEFFFWEFLKYYIFVFYCYDVMLLMDKFFDMDKDNVFVVWKIIIVDQMLYVWDVILRYEMEIFLGFLVVVMV